MTDTNSNKNEEKKTTMVEEKPVKKRRDETEDTYLVKDHHDELWHSAGTNFNDDTPIARAWRRLLDRGIQLGPPLGKEYTSVVNKMNQQLFLYALAEFDTNNDKNPNKAVTFYDARGIVGTESGL
jgi:hypothetical protein